MKYITKNYQTIQYSEVGSEKSSKFFLIAIIITYVLLFIIIGWLLYLTISKGKYDNIEVTGGSNLGNVDIKRDANIVGNLFIDGKAQTNDFTSKTVTTSTLCVNGTCSGQIRTNNFSWYGPDAQVAALSLCTALNGIALTMPVQRLCALTADSCNVICSKIAHPFAPGTWLQCLNTVHIYNVPFTSDYSSKGLFAYNYHPSVCSSNVCGPNYCCCYSNAPWTS
jgi:hypothetical protein